MREHGPGEYIVHIRQDGSATVKRPRKPLEYTLETAHAK